MDSDTICIEALNLEKICRTCLSETEELESLFSELEQPWIEEISYVYEIVMNVTSLRVIGADGLPTSICRNCLEMASNALKFKLQCERSETFLNAYLDHLKHSQDEVTVLEEDQKTAVMEEVTDEKVEMEESVSDCNLPVTKEELVVNPDITLPNIQTDDALNLTARSDNASQANETDDANHQDKAENIPLSKRLEMKRLLRKSSPNKKKKKQASFCTYKIGENGEKIYECSVCKKEYKHSTSLTVHMRSHTFERPYLCTSCGKGFKQFTGLSYHMRSHTGEQPYACKICDKRYRQSASLTAHMRIHTGQRPFLCSVCGKGFRQAPDLGYHMRTHTKEKPYMCNVCGKRMSMQCHLVQHMRTHTGEKPFTCSVCDKAFASTTRLKRHEIIHTGLKPYECEVCSKAFNRASTLRVHAMIHTDVRPHVCHKCGKGFIQAHCLRSHLNSHDKYEQPIISLP